MDKQHKISRIITLCQILTAFLFTPLCILLAAKTERGWLIDIPPISLCVLGSLYQFRLGGARHCIQSAALLLIVWVLLHSLTTPSPFHFNVGALEVNCWCLLAALGISAVSLLVLRYVYKKDTDLGAGIWYFVPKCLHLPS